MSFLGRRINNLEEFRAAQAKAQRELPPYARAFNELLAMRPPPINGRYGAVRGNWLIAEELMSGHQCTLDGLMETRAFPSARGSSIPSACRTESASRASNCRAVCRAAHSNRLAAIAERVMLSLGYRHGLFNIEFFVDPAGRRSRRSSRSIRGSARNSPISMPMSAASRCISMWCGRRRGCRFRPSARQERVHLFRQLRAAPG